MELVGRETVLSTFILLQLRTHHPSIFPIPSEIQLRFLISVAVHCFVVHELVLNLSAEGSFTKLET